MKTLVFASQKGGSGKTTLAQHVATALDRFKHGPVVIIDMDPQQTLTHWWQQREADTPELAEPPVARGLGAKVHALGASGKYAFCIIDTPGGVDDIGKAAIQAADLVVIPSRPSPADLHALGPTIAQARDARRPFVFVVNAAKAGTNASTQVVAALSEHGQVCPQLVGDRTAFAMSTADGRTIGEVDPSGKGAAEVANVMQFLLDRFPEFRPARKEKPRA